MSHDATVAALRRRMLAFYRDWLTIRDLEVPTIAAVNGAAIGAGFAVALACDIRYVATTARLGVPFTSLGLHPGMATTWSLPEVAGIAVARDLLLTGRVVDGEEAVRLGLASRAVPTERVLGEAVAAAERVAAAAPVATALTVAALRDGGHATFEDALRWEGLAQAVTLTTQDVREGIAAAAGRRPPHVHRPLSPRGAAGCRPDAERIPDTDRAGTGRVPDGRRATRCGRRVPIPGPVT